MSGYIIKSNDGKFLSAKEDDGGWLLKSLQWQDDINDASIFGNLEIHIILANKLIDGLKSYRWGYRRMDDKTIQLIGNETLFVI